MASLITLNLPLPSTALVTAALVAANNTIIGTGIGSELKSFSDTLLGKTGSVNQNMAVDETVTQLAVKEYASFFPGEIFRPTVLIFRNSNIDNTNAYMVPHSDIVRTFAINFYIELGGSNVKTIFYTKQDNYLKWQGKSYSYDGLIVENEYITVGNQWYALDARKVHSVENIETNRIVLGLSFYESNQRYENFIINHPELIK